MSLTPVSASPSRQGITVEQAVRDEIQSTGKASYWLKFENSVDLSPAYKMNWEDRGWFVYNSLTAQAKKSQANALAFLNSANVKHTSFWINNSIYVEQSNAAVLNTLEQIEGVVAITAPQEYFVYQPVEQKTAEASKAVVPNLIQINAPEAWELATGDGIVVAGIDTGVRFSHETLAPRYRGNLGNGLFDHNYNWLNAANNNSIPIDEHGHGSHTIGTAVGTDGGTNQIGVAPGAKWIACAACPDGFCADVYLHTCAQFVTAPTQTNGSNPDPSRRAHVVNNSWGNCHREYNDFFQDSIDAWHAAGIYPTFSNGNNTNCGYTTPPPLNTVGSPGRYGSVTGVGSTGRNNGQYASHSNKGPTDNFDTINPIDGHADMKPQVAAPGVDIRSATAASNSSYADWTGTSMSAPHVAGLVALMWQAAPCLIGNYGFTETIIEQSATAIHYDAANDIPGGDNYPNYATGWGEINALAAVQAASGACGNSTISGVVTSTEAGNPPVAGAQVVALTSDGNRSSAVTNADGEYTLNVGPFEWTVTASKFGYDPASQTLTVGDNENLTLDFVLTAHDRITISGNVYDDGLDADTKHGYPLYAKVNFAHPQHNISVYTDPITGYYEAEIYPNIDYKIRTEAVFVGYEVNIETLNFTEDTVRDVHLRILQTCGSPGYKLDFPFFYDFEGSDHGFTSGGANSSWAWGEITSGPGVPISGSHGIATNLDGDYNPNEASWMESPAIDLSTWGSETPVIQFWNWLYTESDEYTWDNATFQVSRDNGATWENKWGPYARQDTEWWKQTITLDPSYNVENFKFRFFFKSDGGGQATGWYVDDIGVAKLDLPEPEVVKTFTFENPSEGLWTTGFYVGANDWQLGEPTTGPGSAHSGTRVWATQLDGNYNSSRTSFITSPPVDLSDHTGKNVEVTWYDWIEVKNPNYNWDFGQVWATKNGGADWAINITGNVLRQDVVGGAYKRNTVVLPPEFATSNFQFRFQFKSDSSGNRAGWYIDDVSIAVQEAFSDVIIPCTMQEGGLVAGYVYDATNPADMIKVIDAKVQSEDLLAVTKENTQDPARRGLYYGFQKAEAPSQDIAFTVSHQDHTTLSETRNVVANAVTQHDYYFGQGGITVTPGSFEETIELGGPAKQATLTISNTGAAEVAFEITESNQEATPAPLAGDIPWLSLTPTTGTVPANGSVEVTLTFDVADMTQAGDYAGELLITTTPEHTVPAIPVTLHILAVESPGTLQGQISATGKCDQNEAPLAEATVKVFSAGALVQTATTDAEGNYSFELPAGTYTLEASKTGYITQTIADIELSAGSIVFQNMTLRMDAPCVTANPSSITQELHVDQFAMQSLTLTNTGAASAAFTIEEVSAKDIPWLAVAPVSGEINPDGGTKVITLSFDATSMAGGTHTGLLNVNVPGDSAINIPVTLTVTVPQYPGTLQGQISATGKCDQNEAPLAEATVKVFSAGTLVQTTTTDAEGNYSFELPAGIYTLEASKTGYVTKTIADIELSASSIVVQNMTLRMNAPCVAANPTSFTQELQAGQTATQTLTLTNTGAASAAFTIEELSTKNIPWLTVAPVSGNINPDGGTVEITLTFDATDMTAGTYNGSLNINVPGEPAINIPVTLTVTADPNLGTLAGTVNGLEACDINPALLAGVTIELYQAGALVDTATSSGTGTFSIEVLAGTYDVKFKHDGYLEAELKDVEVNVAETTTITANLRILKACLVIEPETLENTLEVDETGSQTLTIRNTGAAAGTFQIKEFPAEPPQPAPLNAQPTFTYRAELDLPGMDRAKTAPVTMQGAVAWTPQADALIDEGFENAFPPEGWSIVSKSTWTWETNTLNPHTGTTYANVTYDENLAEQSEWLISPELNLSEGVLKFWSFGSFQWCRDIYDNCDLNVWLIYGEPNATDPANILLGKADDAWTENWKWAESTFDLTDKLTGAPVRIAFHYVGQDGAQIGLDTITLEGSEEVFDVEWLSEDPTSGTIEADGEMTISVTYDATGLEVGDYFANLIFRNAGPQRTVPVTLHVIKGEDPEPPTYQLYLPMIATK